MTMTSSNEVISPSTTIEHGTTENVPALISSCCPAILRVGCRLRSIIVVVVVLLLKPALTDAHVEPRELPAHSETGVFYRCWRT